MTPEETAAATAAGISTIGSHFMMDGQTYKRGAELGFAGMDFYVTGRGGALGPVDADVVTAAFVWWEPGTVRTNWSAERADEAAAEWALCAHAWADAKVPDDVDAARLGELAGRVVETASVAGAPIFAGWRKLPVPTEPEALAVHHLNALRELRGALHGGAALAEGLQPLEAVLVRSPHMAALFGWPEPYADVSDLTGQWERAEAGTNRAIAPAFAGLSEPERAELAELIDRVHTATS